jgi:molybdopterin synthase sulfur carrier subunit
MKIKVRFLGQFKYITGMSEEEIDTKDAVTVRELRDQVRKRYPKIAEKREVLVHINNTLVSPETVIKKNDIVTFFPPVSGG